MPTKLRLHAAPATLVSLAVILALALVGLGAFSGGKAAAVQQVSCGDTITTDTTLHHNLVNCPNNGIIIGADNVTLDLNYHTVDGDGAPAAGCDPNTEVCDSGVVDDGHDGVTVMHGAVREFGVGVLFGTSTAGKVRHNRVIDISSSKNLFFGFVVASSTRSLVRNSSGNGSLAADGDGIGLFDAHHVRILHNSFRHNGELGMHVFESSHNLIKGNRFARNAVFAILMEKAYGNQVRRNRSARDGLTGIVVDLGSRNVIARNRVSHTRRVGGEPGDGIAVEGGHDHLVTRNLVVDARGVGIRLGVGGPHPFGGHDNVVRGNRVRGSADDGFLVNKKDRHSLLKRNISRHNGNDGFDIQNPTAKLTRNRAERNGDLGIAAVRGVIDGGGNKASGNGDPRQCTNIVCR